MSNQTIEPDKCPECEKEKLSFTYSPISGTSAGLSSTKSADGTPSSDREVIAYLTCTKNHVNKCKVTIKL